jgi:hypothetical protein
MKFNIFFYFNGFCTRKILFHTLRSFLILYIFLISILGLNSVFLYFLKILTETTELDQHVYGVDIIPKRERNTFLEKKSATLGESFVRCKIAQYDKINELRTLNKYYLCV